MYSAVQKFFALHHHFALPGIGNFKVEHIPAQIDFTERTVSSSQNKIVFSNEKLPAEKKFYDFLSYEMNIDDVQAIRLFTDFTSQLQHKLKTGEDVYIKGIGKLQQQTSNVMNFLPEEMPDYFPTLTAERIIRKNTMHTVRVGEDEKTSDEMHMALNRPQQIIKEKWWIAATVLAVIGIAAIVFYYAMHK